MPYAIILIKSARPPHMVVMHMLGVSLIDGYDGDTRKEDTQHATMKEQ